MDKLETDFLNTQECLPLVWFRYIDDIFFIWTHGEEKLKFFLDDLNEYRPNINFTNESNKERINFLDLTVSLIDNRVPTDLTRTSIFIIPPLILITPKSQLFTARH